MTDQPTITVESYFGEKQVTRDEFIRRWDDHAAELVNINWSADWQDELQAFREKVQKRAAERFNEMLAAQ